MIKQSQTCKEVVSHCSASAAQRSEAALCKRLQFLADAFELIGEVLRSTTKNATRAAGHWTREKVSGGSFLARLPIVLYLSTTCMKGFATCRPLLDYCLQVFGHYCIYERVSTDFQ